MALTILSIPFIVLGVLINPYSLESTRCFTVRFISQAAYCFEQGSNMPETIKYGSVLAGFALLYAGRRQIKRARGLD
jgi:hypothetical protein